VRALALLEAGPRGFSPEYDAWFSALAEKLEGLAAAGRMDANGEAVLRDVFGAWEELPETWRHVFTANGPALLAEVRGGERLTDPSGLAELAVPTLVVTADDSPEPIRRGSEALARTLPQARAVRAGGGHAIDPAGPEVASFIAEIAGATPTSA
jgi:hypothetical protein